jgi:hypothetical protein
LGGATGSSSEVVLSSLLTSDAGRLHLLPALRTVFHPVLDLVFDTAFGCFAIAALAFLAFVDLAFGFIVW